MAYLFLPSQHEQTVQQADRRPQDMIVDYKAALICYLAEVVN